jgi:hypothetical protein
MKLPAHTAQPLQHVVHIPINIALNLLSQTVKFLAAKKIFVLFKDTIIS